MFQPLERTFHQLERVFHRLECTFHRLEHKLHHRENTFIALSYKNLSTIINSLAKDLETNIQIGTMIFRNKLEEFKPIKENELSMYVCGSTVYNDMHIGNARPVIFFEYFLSSFCLKMYFYVVRQLLLIQHLNISIEFGS